MTLNFSKQDFISFPWYRESNSARKSGTQRRGLPDPPVNEGEDIEHGGHIWVVVSGGLLQVLQGLFAEGHSHLVPPLGGVLDHQVVEGPETGRDLVAPLLGGGHRGAAVARLDWKRGERIAVSAKDRQP